MARFLLVLLSAALLLLGANAQFQYVALYSKFHQGPKVLMIARFFDQMFNHGGQQQRQQPQNVPSDSNWYQENYDAGTYSSFPFFCCLSQTPSYSWIACGGVLLTCCSRSTLWQIPLSGHPCLRSLSSPLPLRTPSVRGEVRTWRRQSHLRIERRVPGRWSSEESRVGKEGAALKSDYTNFWHSELM